MTFDPPARPLRRRTGVLAWVLWVLAMLGLPALLWLQHLLRQAGRPDLAGWSAGDLLWALAAVSAATVGVVVAVGRPRHPVGWLLLALGSSVIAEGVCQAYAFYGILIRPGAVPAARWAAVYLDASWAVFAALIGFILLLTPTGSLPSRRWRWWAIVAGVAPVATVVLEARALDAPFAAVAPPLTVRAVPLEVIAFAGSIITNLAVVVAAASLVPRFRRARGVERQQLRWVVLAAALAAVAVVAILVGWATGAQAVWGWAIVYVVILPLMVGAAVLRYRLYDVDRIISRVVAYGALTVLLGSGYAGIVLALGALLGRSSSVTVAAATLAVAVAFQPTRQRIQNAVDRRFNRRRYDATRTVQRFGVRLRDEIDVAALTGELLAVVDRTVQPSQASLWVRHGR